jgi:hypothetical protein
MLRWRLPCGSPSKLGNIRAGFLAHPLSYIVSAIARGYARKPGQIGVSVHCSQSGLRAQRTMPGEQVDRLGPVSVPLTRIAAVWAPTNLWVPVVALRVTGHSPVPRAACRKHYLRGAHSLCGLLMKGVETSSTPFINAKGR